MYEAVRLFWNAAAVAGAIVVGLFTHDAGLIAITLIGGLVVPRVLGLVPRRGFLGLGRGFGRGWQGGCGGWRQHAGSGAQRFDAWHRDAHAGPSAPPSAPPASTI